MRVMRPGIDYDVIPELEPGVKPIVPMTAAQMMRLRGRLKWTHQRLADELGCSIHTVQLLQADKTAMRRCYGLALRYIELQIFGGPEK